MTVPGPLAGITVVDLTRVLAGPFCTLILSDLGARVIKVEHPNGGDLGRSLGPWFNGKSGYAMSVNRGKESIALDLKADGDRAILHRLLADADVLVENYRAGVMEKLGLGWETLHARYPRLIYAATSGFGHSGPYAAFAAFDLVAQAMGGIMSITGHPGGPPTRVGISIGDIAAGLFTAVGINAALFHRAHGGAGMKIDVAMLDCQVAITENAIVRHFAGERPGPLGARHPSAAPFDAFPAKDGYLIIAIGDDAGFRALCAALAREDLADHPRFTTNALRVTHQQELKDQLSAVLAERTVAAWLAALRPAGVPCGPINAIADVVADPQVAARNMIVEVDDPTAGRVKLFGCPIKMSAFDDPHLRAPAPDLDADRERILAELTDADPQEPMAATVRRLRPDDAEAFVALRREALEREPFAFAAAPEDDRALSLDFVRQVFDSPAQATFGGFSPELVGIVGLHRDAHRKAAHKAHVFGLYVTPPQRRAGLGRSLMAAALRFAGELPGVTQVHLAVAATSPAAIRLYQSLGFVTWGTVPDALRIGGNSVAEHHMMLVLPPRPPRQP